MNTIITLLVLYAIAYVINFILITIRFWRIDKSYDLLLIAILSLYGPQLLIIMLLLRMKGQHFINKYDIDNKNINSW